MSFDSVVRLPEKNTQTYRLLMAMKKGVRLTVAKALNEYGCFALSQRMGDLKRDGWPVMSRTIKTASGARISEYWLSE